MISNMSLYYFSFVHFIVSAASGNGPFFADPYHMPQGICLTPDGKTMYIAEWGNHQIQVISNLKFSSIHFDSFFFIVFHSVQVVNAENGNRIDYIGSEGSAPGEFKTPRGVVVSPGGTLLYVSDMGNNRIQVFRTADRSFRSAFGRAGDKPGEFDSPVGLALSSTGKQLYVADMKNHRIQVFQAETGEFLREFGHAGTEPGSLGLPHALALARIGGKEMLFVTETANHRVQAFRANKGTFVYSVGVPGAAPVEFNHPGGIAVSPSGDLLVVSDTINNRLQVLRSADGAFVSMIGIPGRGSGEFDSPYGVAISPSGMWIYAADAGNNRIQAFSTRAPPQAAAATPGSTMPTA
jgi:DNA-binding beta-propeller fold protein YncE